jgi:Flp pilus assembly protein TadD
MLAVNLSPDPTVVEAALAKAVTLSPKDPIVIRRVCDQLLRSDMDAEERVTQISQFVTDDPNNAYLQQRLGTAAAIAEQFDLAEKAWLTAEDLAPANPSPPAFLASLFEQQGRNDEARSQATIALDLLPADPELVRGLQAILSKVGG